MARLKLPVTRTLDLAFLRKVIREVSEVRGLRKYADDHVLAIRSDIAARVDKALWNRYRVYHRKDENPPPFLEWVLSRAFLHDTYLRHRLSTRLRWVYRVVQSAKHEALSLFGELPGVYGAWYASDLERLINARRTVEAFELRLIEDETEVQDIEGKVPTIRIEKDPLLAA
jgi:hypothetical protein